MISFTETDRFTIGNGSDDRAQQLYDRESGIGWLGYDREHRRLVEIHQPNLKGARAALQRKVLTERLADICGLFHPGIASVLTVDEDEHGDLLYITEFVDGERLQAYLERQTVCSRRLGMSLVLQLARVVAYLADFPRVLTSLTLSDFAVTLDRGRFVALRLTDFGLDQEENPVRETVLAVRWIRWIGGLVESINQTQTGKLGEISMSGPSPNSPLDRFITRIDEMSGKSAMSELKNLEQMLLKAAGFENTAAAVMQPESRSVEKWDQVPKGPLSSLIADVDAMEAQLQFRYQLLPKRESASQNDWSPFTLQANDIDQPGSTRLTVLPPERLIDHQGTGRLYQKISHSYLKKHPKLIRTREIVGNADFTVLVEDSLQGFSLSSLLAERGRLKPSEMIDVLKEVDIIMTLLERSNLSQKQLDPTQIDFHFDPEPSEAKMKSILAKESLQQWPGYELKLRIGPTTASLVEAEASSWREILSRMNGSTFPALALWMLEGDRFEWSLIEGRIKEEPHSWDATLEGFFSKVATHFEVKDPSHRRFLLESLMSIFDYSPDADILSLPSGPQERLTTSILQPSGSARIGLANYRDLKPSADNS